MLKCNGKEQWKNKDDVDKRPRFWSYLPKN